MTPQRMTVGLLTLSTVLTGLLTMSRGEDGRLRHSADHAASNQLGLVSERRPQRPMIKHVLVLNFNPIVPSSGGQTLSEYFHWSDPRVLAQQYIDAIRAASDETVLYRVHRWVDIDDIPVKEDGHDYSTAEYVANRISNSGWQDNETADYYGIIDEYAVAQAMRRGIDEVWLFGDHYFGFWEASMAGPGAYFINGGVYPAVSVRKPFAIMGFSYERKLPEMLHNLGHRTENHLLRAFGESWNMAQPEDAWDDFTANLTGTGGEGPFGVGNVHFPFNGRSDYDYENATPVLSYAYEFENYPFHDTTAAQWLTCSEWIDQGISFEQWWLDRLPDNSGTDFDGRQNNWWRYIVDFNDYLPGSGLPVAP
jgi:hypothetical protein